MDKIYRLTEADVAILKSMVADFKRRPRSLHTRTPSEFDYPQAPETYVGRVGILGIPAMDEHREATGTGGLNDDEPGEGRVNIYQLLFGDDGGPYLTDTGLEKDVYNLTGAKLLPYEWVLLTRDKYGKWFAIKQQPYIYIRLTAKDYTASTFISYSWTLVEDSPSVTYTDKPTFGCPGHFPAYHIRNLDLPINPALDEGTGTGSCLHYTSISDRLSVVRAWRGNGRFYLFDIDPWQDIFRRTGETDELGREIAYHRYWDQNTQTWKDGREVRLVEAE